MLKYLRSIQSLLVFEAAGRHRSFSQAAAELHVTPSAVSRQIRMLEEDLGTPLFVRLHRGIDLTAAGATYLAEVSAALARLDAAGKAVRAERAERALRISVLHGFAGGWLVPRLPRFAAKHPEIEIRLEATSAYADFRRDDVDLAIRFGGGEWPGLEAERLLELDLYPVCAPRLTRGRAALRQPRDLAAHTWLTDVRVPDAWSHWLRAAGVGDLRPKRLLEYDNSQLVLEAVIAGLGVALTSDLIAERPLREGRLLRPFAISYRSPHTYHLVARRGELARAPLRSFRDWIHAEMEAWRGRRTASRRVQRVAAKPRSISSPPRVRAR